MRLLLAFGHGADIAARDGPGVLHSVPFLVAQYLHVAGVLVSQSAVPDASAGCGGVHDPRPAVGGNPLGFAEYSVGVALKRDVERAHPLVSRGLLKRDDGAANGQVRFFLQYEPSSIPQFSSWGKDVSAESGYHQRAHVDWELGAVVVADGKRDDASPDAVEGVFSSCRDLSWRR